MLKCKILIEKNSSLIWLCVILKGEQDRSRTSVMKNEIQDLDSSSKNIPKEAHTGEKMYCSNITLTKKGWNCTELGSQDSCGEV